MHHTRARSKRPPPSVWLWFNHTQLGFWSRHQVVWKLLQSGRSEEERWGSTQRVETGGSDFWEENNIQSVQFC